MLADSSDALTKSGELGRDVHLPSASRYALIDFIGNELPAWRDRADRGNETSETVLTSHLSTHLTSAARYSKGWDILQFRTEVPDEKNKGRKIDLAPSPCAATIWIDGRRHTDFDILFPIECKRLPTPASKDRDEREYVINRYASTGGIQRFKAGHHGAGHAFGAMIAYVQEETMAEWDKRIEGWITELAISGEPGWTTADLLHLEREDTAQHISIHRSSHTRGRGLQDIELRHLWLQMD